MSLSRLIPEALTIDFDVDVDVSVEIDDDELDVLAEAVDAHIRQKFEQHRADDNDPSRYGGQYGGVSK